MGIRLELFIRILLSFVLGVIIGFWAIWAGICWCLQFLIILDRKKECEPA
ncbi:MAG: DUF4389 domain-containing protein [Candidatus Aenigmarchaeota archaeon]|nr:DUF4389 domain-containing protein [Candidatus Aenigmarchaeota archaeon]